MIVFIIYRPCCRLHLTLAVVLTVVRGDADSMSSRNARAVSTEQTD